MKKSFFPIAITTLLLLYIITTPPSIRAQDNCVCNGELEYSLDVVNGSLFVEFTANASGTDKNSTLFVIAVDGQPLVFEAFNGSIVRNVTLGLIEALLIRNITAYVITIINGSAHVVRNISVAKEDISMINPVTDIKELIVPDDSDLNGFADIVRGEVRVFLRDSVGEGVVDSVVRELNGSVFLVCGGVYSSLDDVEYVSGGGFVKGVYSCSEVDRLVEGSATVSLIYRSRYYGAVLDSVDFGRYLSVFESRYLDLELRVSVGSKDFETYLRSGPSVFNVGYFPVGNMEVGVRIANRGLGVTNLSVVVGNESRSCSFLGMNSSVNYDFGVRIGEGLNIIPVEFLHKGVVIGKKTVVVRGYNYSCLGVSAEAVGDYLRLTFSNACNMSVSGFVMLGDEVAYFSVGEGQSISSYLRYGGNSSVLTLPLFVKTFVGYAYAGNVTVEVVTAGNSPLDEVVTAPQGVPWYAYALVAAGAAAAVIAWRWLVRQGGD